MSVNCVYIHCHHLRTVSMEWCHFWWHFCGVYVFKWLSLGKIGINRRPIDTAITRHSPNVGSKSIHRLRRRPSIELTSGWSIVFHYTFSQCRVNVGPTSATLWPTLNQHWVMVCVWWGQAITRFGPCVTPVWPYQLIVYKHETLGQCCFNAGPPSMHNTAERRNLPSKIDPNHATNFTIISFHLQIPLLFLIWCLPGKTIFNCNHPSIVLNKRLERIKNILKSLICLCVPCHYLRAVYEVYYGCVWGWTVYDRGRVGVMGQVISAITNRIYPTIMR